MRWPKRCTAGLAIAIFLVAPSAPSVAGGSGTAIPSACDAQPATTTTVAMTVDGLNRSVIIHVPARAPGTPPTPLVLALHGAAANGKFMEGYSDLDRVADADDFVVAYPSARAPSGTWQINAHGDDIAFLGQTIDTLTSTLCVNPSRVDAVGVSNGGAMVALMGCELSGQLDAIATVAGSYREVPWCTPQRPLSVLEIHGTEDPVVPYHTVAGWLAQWRVHDRCAGAALRAGLAHDVQRLQWRCSDGTVITHVRVDGMGHAWPGSYADKQWPVNASDIVGAQFSARAQAPRYRP